MQEVALLEVQFSVDEPPLCTALGPALRLTMGAEGLTDTVSDCVAVPPAPEQVNK